jgi:dihydroorotate dehydrogenase (fumarate)
MDLTTTYLGFDLPHPIIAGASPLSRYLDRVRQLEDAGIAMITLHSLFEEQLINEELATNAAIDDSGEQYAEALSYFPTPPDFAVGPDEYLDMVRKVKDAVAVPVVGSLNGITRGGWLRYAALIEQAGADALELNTYNLVTDSDENAWTVEREMIEMVRAIKAQITIPLSVKLSPFYTALPNLAKELALAGADGLVLFNRFYQPDIDVEELEVNRLSLSDSTELLLRLHWTAILAGQVNASLAITGGVHSALDLVKSVMVGAHAVQLVSAILKQGPRHVTDLRLELISWLEQHEYHSLRQMQGSMSLRRCPDPKAYERANYIHMLQSYQVE